MFGCAYDKTAFISTIAIDFPIQACGPAINDSTEKVGWYVGGRLSHREGLKLQIGLVGKLLKMGEEGERTLRRLHPILPWKCLRHGSENETVLEM